MNAMKIVRWVVFVLGAGAVAVGAYLGLEPVVALGAGAAGWATPWVMDKKLANAARQLIALLAHEDSPPELHKAGETVAAKKVAALVAKKSKKA